MKPLLPASHPRTKNSPNTSNGKLSNPANSRTRRRFFKPKSMALGKISRRTLRQSPSTRRISVTKLALPRKPSRTMSVSSLNMLMPPRPYSRFVRSTQTSSHRSTRSSPKPSLQRLHCHPLSQVGRHRRITTRRSLVRSRRAATI